MKELLKRCKDKYGEIYQPIYKGEQFGLIYSGVRDHEGRLNSILNFIGDTKDKLILDVGSNLGYFTFALADSGAYVVSVEEDPLYCEFQYKLAEKLGLLNRIIILNADVTEISEEFWKRSFAHFDVILFMSIWHHILGRRGLSKALDICSKLFRLTEYVIFDTGQSDEIRCAYKDRLPNMTQRPYDWIFENIFGDKIYVEKKVLGGFKVHTSNKPRWLLGVKVDYDKKVQFVYPYETCSLKRNYEINIEDKIIHKSDKSDNFVFGGNLNDLLFYRALLDYKYLSKRLIKKSFDLYNDFGSVVNDLRVWNVIFSLKDYDLFFIDWYDEGQKGISYKEFLDLVRFILYSIYHKRVASGETYENIGDYVKSKVGDFGIKCKTENDFIDLINNLRWQ